MPVENKEYFDMAKRIVKNGAKRVARADGEDLLYLVELQKLIDDGIEQAVKGLKEQGHSWGYIAKCLGLSRQYCHKKWGEA